MNYFIFNGKKSTDYDIIIKKMPDIVKPSKRIEKIVIPGRNGELHQDDGTYDSYTIQIECALIEQRNIYEIKEWLNGSGDLILSNDPSKFYKASIINKIDYTSIVNVIHEFPLELEIQPFSYSLEKYVKIIKDVTEYTLNIPDATAEMEPYIKVTADTTITLMINGESMILDVDEYIELDCSLLMAHKNYVSADDTVKGNFYKLKPGINTISILGEYSELKIVYRKAYL